MDDVIESKKVDNTRDKIFDLGDMPSITIQEYVETEEKDKGAHQDTLVSEIDDAPPMPKKFYPNYATDGNLTIDKRDSKGRSFCAEIHLTRDNCAVLTKKGYLRLKSGFTRDAKKAQDIYDEQNKTESNDKDKIDTQIDTQDQDEKINENQLASTARMCATILPALGRALFSKDEWKESSQEKNAMETAYANYLREKNIVNVPPSTALFISLFTFCLPRFFNGVTQEKIKEWFDKFTKKKEERETDKKDADQRAIEIF